MLKELRLDQLQQSMEEALKNTPDRSPKEIALRNGAAYIYFYPDIIKNCLVEKPPACNMSMGGYTDRVLLKLNSDSNGTGSQR